nr:hypothetical protein [Sphingomonas morindae]
MCRSLRAGKRIGGALEVRVTGFSRISLASLDAVPKRLGHDAQLRLVADDPFRFRVEPRPAREAAPVVRHLHPGAAVEDAAPDIKLVVEDALTQRHVTRQGRRVPDAAIIASAFASTRGGDPFGVERGADALQAPAVRIEGEDAQHERCLGTVNGEAVCLAALCVVADDLAPIAEHTASGGPTPRRLAAQAAPGRIGDTHTLLLADDALEGEDEVIDLARRHRMHRDPVQPEQLDHVEEMLGVTAQPVDILDDEGADLTIGDERQHLLEARPFHGRARDAVIAVEGDHLEAMSFGIAQRKEPLVVDG